MNDILKQWAEKLNGREYRSELTRDEEKELKEQGIVAVFGYSDDLCELRGAADDEMDCYDGNVIFIKPNGDALYSVENADTYKPIYAIWNENGIPWTYQTDIPHETFDILENGEIYCKGILLSLADVAPKPTNYERIKAMSIEEMAEYFCKSGGLPLCPLNASHCRSNECPKCFKRWLESVSDDKEE